MHLLFVYGKLRKGGGNSLPDNFPGSKYFSDARLTGNLYDLGDYPGLVLGDLGEVIGEVYEIDDETLSLLDEFEATANYRRSEVSISINDRPTSCWIYCPELDRCQGETLIPSGDWIDYLRK